MNIRLTGPTPMPPAVKMAAAAGVMSHRSNAYRSLQRRVEGRLRVILGCDHPDSGLVLLTCSGTGGLEAALVNCFEDGDRVLACSVGLFGERLAAIARVAGLTVEEWAVPWGAVLDPAALAARLAVGPPYRGVLLTHNETSTGVLNPLPDLVRAVRAGSDALVVVDAVSSAGAVPVNVDANEIDAVVTASQKALMAPAGVAVVALGPRATEAVRRNQRSRYYFDLRRSLAAATAGTSAFTPSLPAVRGLDAATSLILGEGLPSVYARHARLRDGLRDALASAGIPRFVTGPAASPTVTAIPVPDGEARELRRRLRDRHAILVSGGRGRFEDSMVRVGHMGHVTEQDLQPVVAALTEELAS